MKTVILCGGQGTRIRDVSEVIPKPLIALGDRPILWHIMKYYACFGHEDFVLCLGHKGRAIRDFFLNYEASMTDLTVRLGAREPPEYHGEIQEAGWRVTLAETGISAMTGARVRKIERYVAGETFFLTYGDGVGNVAIDRLLAFHKSHGRTMTVTGAMPPGRFGELVLGDEGRVVGFNEKPQVTGGRISAGFFVCEPRLFDVLPDRDDLVLEQEPMQELVRRGELVMYPHDGFWHPMDTQRDLRFLTALVERNEAPWIIW